MTTPRLRNVFGEFLCPRCEHPTHAAEQICWCCKRWQEAQPAANPNTGAVESGQANASPAAVSLTPGLPVRCVA